MLRTQSLGKRKHVCTGSACERARRGQTSQRARLRGAGSASGGAAARRRAVASAHTTLTTAADGRHSLRESAIYGKHY